MYNICYAGLSLKEIWNNKIFYAEFNRLEYFPCLF